jgi:hypothetical protein
MSRKTLNCASTLTAASAITDLRSHSRVPIVRTRVSSSRLML